jgi:hypothetical protein
MRIALLTSALCFGLVSPLLVQAQDTSCGIAWGPILNLSGNNPYTYDPQIVAQGETLHVTWEGGGYRLAYRRSFDNGLNWEPTREMIADTSIENAHYPWIVADNRFIYLVYTKSSTQGTSPPCMLKSSDRGATWSQEDSIAEESGSAIRNVFLRGDTMVVQFERQGPHDPYTFFRSTDAGATWDTSLVPVRGPVAIGGGVFHNAWGGVIVGHGQEVTYKRSTDLGNSWQDSLVLSSLDGEWSHEVTMALTNDTPPRVYVMWRDTKYGCLTLFGCSIILRISGDGGLSWGEEYLMTDAPVGYNTYLHEQIAFDATRVTVVWKNDQSGHINMRYSTDQGDSWTPLCDVTPGRVATEPEVAMTPGTVHMAWEDIDTVGPTSAIHIYYRRGTILTDQVSEGPYQDVPSGFTLYQNYPNPFNGQTWIDYWLESRGPDSKMKLAVYNILGQEVASLVDGFQPAGRQSFLWNPKNIPSGVYICRMSVFKGTQILGSQNRMMVILK